MYANINNIRYVNENNLYYIITEYSRMAIESFETEKEAKDFMRGYLMNTNGENAENKGKLFRQCVQRDISLGAKYYKVRDIELKIVS